MMKVLGAMVVLCIAVTIAYGASMKKIKRNALLSPTAPELEKKASNEILDILLELLQDDSSVAEKRSAISSADGATFANLLNAKRTLTCANGGTFDDFNHMCECVGPWKGYDCSVPITDVYPHCERLKSYCSAPHLKEKLAEACQLTCEFYNKA